MKSASRFSSRACERAKSAGYAAIAAIAAIAVGVVTVKVAGNWLAATENLRDPAARAEEVGRARTVVIAVLAGGLAAIGAYYTHRGFGLSRQGQITERFTRAVDQLGSASRDVKVGGIYALERLARESRDDHRPIVEILTAFVRERTSIPPEDVEAERIQAEPDRYPEPPGMDVQAALTVLGRRHTAYDPPLPWRLDLSGAYLPKANLDGSDLAQTDLSNAVLDLARLNNARLSEAVLVDVRLAYAKLHSADLERADLSGASLGGADMTRADLTNARLRGAHYSEKTAWPDGFDAEESGASLSAGK